MDGKGTGLKIHHCIVLSKKLATVPSKKNLQFELLINFCWHIFELRLIPKQQQRILPQNPLEIERNCTLCCNFLKWKLALSSLPKHSKGHSWLMHEWTGQDKGDTDVCWSFQSIIYTNGIRLCLPTLEERGPPSWALLPFSWNRLSLKTRSQNT